MRQLIIAFVGVAGILYGIVDYFQNRAAESRLDTWLKKNPSRSFALEKSVLKNIARREKTQEDFDREAAKYINAKDQIEATNRAIRDYEPMRVEDMKKTPKVPPLETIPPRWNGSNP